MSCPTRLGLRFLLLISFISALAFADPEILKKPTPSYPQGEVRMRVVDVYEGRAESRKATGEKYHEFIYHAGPEADSKVVGELSFKTNQKDIKWGRIDSYDPGKGIATLLYGVALDSEPVRNATEIKTYWTDDNAFEFRKHREAGLSHLEAGKKTPSAKTFTKHGWQVDYVNEGEYLFAIYRRAPSSGLASVCAPPLRKVIE